MFARVSSANADNIDQQVQSWLIGDVEEALHRLRILGLDSERLRPEIELAIKSFVWFNSVHLNGATIAQRLLRLRLVNSKDKSSLSEWKSYAYLFGSVIIPWFCERYTRRTTRPGALERFQQLYKMMDLINFLIFLRKGVYLKFWHRILGIACGMSKADMFLHRNYEFMNEELIYFAASEFFTYVIPLVNVPMLRNLLRRRWNDIHNLPASISSSKSKSPTTSNVTNLAQQRQHQDLEKCGLCGQFPFNPHEIGCKHVFCYYCVRSSFEQDRFNGFTCFDCNRNIIQSNHIQKVQLSCI